MEFPVGLCLAALLLMSGVAKAQNDPCQALQCTDSEECTTISGAFGCGCQSRPNSDSFDAIQSCASSSSNLSLSRCQLFEAGLNITSLHLNDPRCTGSIQNGRVFFHFDNEQNVCGTTLRSNGTHFLYENSIQKGAGSEGLISRHSWVNINFSCVYPLIQSISMPMSMSIQASRGGVVFKELLNQGSYQIRMIPYPNASYIAPYSGDVTVDVNQQIFVAVEVEGVDNQQISTVLDHCWATPSDEINSTIRWDLIINDCPNPRDGTVQVLQNGVSTSARFSFRMFTFTSVSDKVYLHCEVHLCLKNKGSCVQSCNPGARRRRRSLNYLEPAAVTMAF
ncbi:pancreatic secretory granule membrane major glycoprotein GP2-like [Colossoma macropomum]|uniref:pancreatic secretory granule membrane major glycoprotein GP2-like n=1 Tax=Colossoma macropomum TaxID=42526 RepID=UPI001865298F|nr:pancreatic secretory granule membrane major glycoprotein GP2-like [Colossoma macropomum]